MNPARPFWKLVTQQIAPGRDSIKLCERGNQRKKSSCSRHLLRNEVAASRVIIPAYSTYLVDSGIAIAT
jgi:hypothetical protein